MFFDSRSVQCSVGTLVIGDLARRSHTDQECKELHNVWQIRARLGMTYLCICAPTNGLQRPSQVRAYLENEHMPVYDAPNDEGDHAPRQSYNFAPGYHGIVYRADTPDWGAGRRHHKKGEGESDEQPAVDTEEETSEPHDVRYRMQSMKWGLIPFWTKRNPDYGSMMKTINCRDDSLIENKGMWTTMKQKKRCIVVAQGFYEWLKKGKDKIPHFVKRKDGKLMCFAGLWDCVQYEGLAPNFYSMKNADL
jgi:putative SOS response-associated peptidase YedK